MLQSVVLALILPFAGMIAVFLVYISLLWYAARHNSSSMEKPKNENGLSTWELDKLPKITGHDLMVGRDCAICLDEIEIHQPAIMIPGCNHGYHLPCADAWLSKHRVCPVCRAKLEPELFYPPAINPC